MQRIRRTAKSTGGDDAAGRTYRVDEADLARFAGSRAGVEAFVETGPAETETTAAPATAPPPRTTVLLVADDGAWTRRPMPGPQAALQLARRLGIPAYDAAVVGYPARMRAYSARLAAESRLRLDPGA